MNEPRRLKHGGGAAERLLRSAVADGPGGEARRKAALLASTGGGLSRTARIAPARSPGGTFLRWAALAAAASLPLAYIASKLLVGPAPPSAAAPPIIAAETTADLRALDEARSALARRDYAAALSALDGAAQARPNEPLHAEALRLRARVLRETGRADEASALERQLPAPSR